MRSFFSPVRALPVCFLIFTLCTLLLPLPGKASPQTQMSMEESQAAPKQESVQAAVKKELSPAQIVKETTASLLKMYSELVEKHRLEAPWRKKWDEARRQITTIQDRAETLSDAFNNKRDLLLYVSTCERQFSQLLPSYNRYQRWASLMEAVRNRITLIRRDLNRDLAPLYAIRTEMEKLHENVSSIRTATMPNFSAIKKICRKHKKSLKKSLSNKKPISNPPTVSPNS